MKRILPAFLFIPFFSFSQAETGTTRWNAGLFVLPEINALAVQSMAGTQTVDPGFGFSAGLALEFEVSDQLSLRSGLGYGLKKYNHLHEGLIFNSDIDPQQGVVSESRLESEIAFSEIQLPFLIQYRPVPRFFVAGGVEFNAPFADRSHRIIYYGNGDVEELNNENIPVINYGPLISFGYRQPFGDHSSLLIEPMVKYYINEYLVPQSRLSNYGLRLTYLFGG